MKFFYSVREHLYWAFFPGMNLHARERYQRLPPYFHNGAPLEGSLILDAGCGNGMLSYKSCQLGANVIGVSVKRSEVEKASRLFNDYHGISTSRLTFQETNLYELNFPNEHFDQIVCAEVLEHLRRDEETCATFHRLLKPGGFLHICTPNSEHPYNKSFPLDHGERGGHVRPGYTVESLKTILEALGFEVVATAGLGGSIRQAINRRIKETQTRFGAVAGLPLFLVGLLILPLEQNRKNLRQPFSIYVKARKRFSRAD